MYACEHYCIGVVVNGNGDRTLSPSGLLPCFAGIREAEVLQAPIYGSKDLRFSHIKSWSAEPFGSCPLAITRRYRLGCVSRSLPEYYGAC